MHPRAIRSLAFSRDGRVLVSASYDGPVILWDVETREPMGPDLMPQNPGLRAVSLSPDAALVAVGNEDGTVVLWEARDRQTRRTPASAPRDERGLQSGRRILGVGQRGRNGDLLGREQPPGDRAPHVPRPRPTRALQYLRGRLAIADSRNERWERGGTAGARSWQAGLGPASPPDTNLAPEPHELATPRSNDRLTCVECSPLRSVVNTWRSSRRPSASDASRWRLPAPSRPAAGRAGVPRRAPLRPRGRRQQLAADTRRPTTKLGRKSCSSEATARRSLAICGRGTVRPERSSPLAGPRPATHRCWRTTQTADAWCSTADQRAWQAPRVPSRTPGSGMEGPGRSVRSQVRHCAFTPWPPSIGPAAGSCSTGASTPPAGCSRTLGNGTDGPGRNGRMAVRADAYPRGWCTSQRGARC